MESLRSFMERPGGPFIYYGLISLFVGLIHTVGYYDGTFASVWQRIGFLFSLVLVFSGGGSIIVGGWIRLKKRAH